MAAYNIAAYNLRIILREYTFLFLTFQKYITYTGIDLIRFRLREKLITPIFMSDRATE